MRATLLSVLLLAVAACAGSADPPAPPGCAHVTDVAVTATGDRFRVDATVQSADTGAEKYADAWEVRAPDGTVLAVRELLHPHVDEQPFTRSLTDVEIPAGVRTVTVAARDSVLGYCGDTSAAPVPGR